MREGIRRMTAAILTGVLLCMTAGCGGKEEPATLEEVRETQDKDASEEQKKPEESETPQADADSREPEDTDTDGVIYVFVCGQVTEPGVYELSKGSRICEAITAAGGMLETAATDWVNQAEVAEDGQKIYVPSKDEAESMPDGQMRADGQTMGAAGTGDGKVHLNQASREELMTLTGIGETKADAIIRYRESNGGFRSLEELMQVEGIKEGTYNKIKDSIAI